MSKLKFKKLNRYRILGLIFILAFVALLYYSNSIKSYNFMFGLLFGVSLAVFWAACDEKADEFETSKAKPE